MHFPPVTIRPQSNKIVFKNLEKRGRNTKKKPNYGQQLKQWLNPVRNSIRSLPAKLLKNYQKHRGHHSHTRGQTVTVKSSTVAYDKQ